MVVGRVFRRVGRFVGRVHGRVFRTLGRLPIVGGAFKAIGNISAKGLGLLGAMTPMAMLGLGEYSPFSSFTSGFAQGSIGEQNGTQGIGNQFNNIFGAPIDMAGKNFGLFGMPQQQFPGVYGPPGGYGMPFGPPPMFGGPFMGPSMPMMPTTNININFRPPCCPCSCGYRPF